MKIRIDNDKCLRCGMCTGICMEVFDFDENGDIKVNEESVDNNLELVEEAIASCPVNAIGKEEE